jgi:hypothetical protein
MIKAQRSGLNNNLRPLLIITSIMFLQKNIGLKMERLVAIVRKKYIVAG